MNDNIMQQLHAIGKQIQDKRDIINDLSFEVNLLIADAIDIIVDYEGKGD